jgi:coproporphyrinogen III oxidase-like Fe-S oxidoreductase
MTSSRAPRYRVTVCELHNGKTTKVIDAYGNAFITAIATVEHDITTPQDDIMEVHFGEGGPRDLQQHIAAAITDEYSPRRRR